MGIEVNGKVGPGFAQDGSLVDPRMTKDLATVSQMLHGNYYETTYRGNVFTASTAAAGITLVALNVSPLTVNTGIPIIGLWNPPGSGKNLVINKVNVGFISATASIGNIVWNYALNQTITSTPTANGAVSNFLGNGSAVAKVFVNAVMTGSTVGIMLRPAFQVQFVTAVNEIVDYAEQDIGGDIIVPPGAWIALANGVSNASAAVITASVTWEEVAI
jgi:hypothetical protein